MEFQIAARKNANALIVLVDNRQTRDIMGLHRLTRFTNSAGRRHRQRVAYYAVRAALNDFNLANLLFNTKVAVNNSDTAFLSQGNCQSRFGNRIHGRRGQRDIQAYIARKTSERFYFSRENIRFLGYKKDVVKGEG